jgi:hypothetical protein
MGREYKTDEFLRDVVAMAGDLAKNAKVEQPLPPDTDLTDDEQKEIQMQVRLWHVSHSATLA